MQPLRQVTPSSVHTAVDYITSCELPTQWATFSLHAFIERDNGKEHLLLTLGDVSTPSPVLTRLHSECLTGDALFSQRCDCGAQLEKSMQAIAAEGRGVLLYLRQEGRGIGLLHKIQAYQLQDKGADTVQANQRLGFADDMRDYRVCQPMLAHFNITQLRLITNNPRKVAALSALGFDVVERLPLITAATPHNQHYLATKVAKLGHLIPQSVQCGVD